MKKSGFTLIELLAVIVILAIIALIATPIVMNTIETSKMGAIERSAEHYLNAVKVKFTESFLDTDKLEDGRYTIDSNGNLVKNGKVYEIEVNGTKPIGGQVIISEGKVEIGTTLTIEKYVISYGENSNVTISVIDENKVYGLKLEGTTYTRLNDAVGLEACVGTDTEPCENDFDKEEIYREMIEVRDVYGNQFIRIPKFYIKKVVTENSQEWYISKKKQDDGYYLPAVFKDEESNTELDYVLVGKYDASLNEDKLESKTGIVAQVSQNLNKYRTYALANNINGETGYQLLDLHTIDLLQTLFYIEFGTLDSQSIMRGYTRGNYINSHKPTVNGVSSNLVTLSPVDAELYKVGQRIDIGTSLGGRQVAQDRLITSINQETGAITFDGTPVDITTSMYIYNVATANGQSDNILTSSGSSVSNTDGKYSMSYRGIENLYGNIFQFIDGININDNQSYVALDAKKYASDEFDEIDGYYALNYANATTDRYVRNMGYDSRYPFAQIPQIIDLKEKSPYKDYYTRTTGSVAAAFGGSWNMDNYGGIAYWFMAHSSQSGHFRYGSRLVKTAL